MKLQRNLSHDALSDTAHRARTALARGAVDRELLAKLYQAYNPLEDIDLFIDRSLQLFPALSCGVASVYLQNLVGGGEIVRGSYRGINHTFYRAPCGRIVDITADQFGGPQIYVGSLEAPWSGSPFVAGRSVRTRA